jgi:uncharacterized repeat protein (TIGR03803 family)
MAVNWHRTGPPRVTHMFRSSLNLRASLGIACALLIACAASAQAQSADATYTVVAFAYGTSMLQAGDQNFYGISTSVELPCVPGVGECNKIYQVTPGGDSSAFYQFAGTNSNSPSLNSAATCQLTDLIVGTDGSLYGTCIYGGNGGNGSIFKIPIPLDSSEPNPATLATFGVNAKGVPDPGYQPQSLVEGNDGDFYFTNSVGVYKLDSSNGNVSTVYTFPIQTPANICTNGCFPTSIMQGSDGNFYLTLAVSPGAVAGYIESGGIGDQPGAIVQISPGGQFQLIHTLAANGSEGDTPSGPLVQDSTGALYGMTASSNNNYLQTAAGVAFKVTTAGQYTILHSFTGGADGMVDVDKFMPTLILGSDGNLYGTTVAGGNTTSENCTPFGCGTVFQLTTSGALTTLYTFTGGYPEDDTTTVAQNPQVNGAGPRALVQTTGGSFYGIQEGGADFPVVFQISLTDPIPPPIQITFDPATVAPGDTTTLGWSVLNAFSLTAQQCSASIVGNPAGADAADWTGVQSGSLSGLVYEGSTTITPTASGNFTYALTCGGQESGFATLAVNNNSSLQIVPPSMAALQSTVSQEYELDLTAFGGTEPYTWSISPGGTVPPGLTFDEENGKFTGTPQQFGKYSLVVEVEDSSKPNPLPPQPLSITFNVVSGLNLLNSLPNGVVGTNYPGSLAPLTTGGSPPYTWALTGGTLPAGLQLIPTTGAIAGTPTTQGSYSFTITVSDSEDPQATFQQSFNISIGGQLQLTTPSPLTPNAAVGEYYSVPLAASGGTPPYTFSFVTNAGSVPPGLNISSDGIISGTPTQYTTAAGGYNNFFVMVTDSSNPQLSSPFGMAIQVQSTLQIVPPTQGDGDPGLPDGTVGVLTSVPLMATGGVPPYKWSATSTPSANLDLAIVDGNVLQYFPTAALYYMVTLTVADSEQFPPTPQVVVPLMTVPLALPTTTTLTSSNTAAGTGESVTLTANVAKSAGSSPSGQVIFSYATTTLGTATLDADGNATLQTSFSATGVYNITASYGGNGTDAPSVSNSLTETVVTPGITAAVNPTSLSIQPGSSGQLVITITPIGGYTGTINFSCGTLPAHVSCTFAPPALALNGAGPFTDTLTVSTNAATTAQLHIPGGSGKLDALLLAALLWLPGSAAAIFGLKRRKSKHSTSRPLFWVIAILLWIGASALSSCGGKSSFAAPGTYTIPITLTVSGGSTQNINATVVVE